MKILLVEDEWLLAADATDRLEDAGYRVVGPFGAVSDALRELERELPDAAILDIQLVSETSFPIARRLIDRGVPFFFLSGHSKADYAAELGDATVLPKPPNWGQVLRLLEQKLVT